MDKCSWIQITDLSYLRFCFQSLELSPVMSVPPLSLSNLPWHPHPPVSLNLPLCLQWPPPSWLGCIPGASPTHWHAALIFLCLLPFYYFLKNTLNEKHEGRCYLFPSAKTKFPISGRTHSIFHPGRSGQNLCMNLIPITLLLSNFILLVYTAAAYSCSFALR